MRLAQLLLGLTGIMVSGEEFEASAEDAAVSLALSRVGLARAEQARTNLPAGTTFSSPAPAPPPAPRAAWTWTGCSARTPLAIEDFLGIAWFDAAPLRSPHSPAELAAAGFHTMLAQLQLKYRNPDTAAGFTTC